MNHCSTEPLGNIEAEAEGPLGTALADLAPASTLALERLGRGGFGQEANTTRSLRANQSTQHPPDPTIADKGPEFMVLPRLSKESASGEYNLIADGDKNQILIVL